MHGDSLLMLTTKVVSNKKPPLLSDSESGGSTSPDNIPALDRQISQQIQNAITKGELHQAKNKSKNKSYSYER